jgi:hypothetical protein
MRSRGGDSGNGYRRQESTRGNDPVGRVRTPAGRRIAPAHRGEGRPVRSSESNGVVEHVRGERALEEHAGSAAALESSGRSFSWWGS